MRSMSPAAMAFSIARTATLTASVSSLDPPAVSAVAEAVAADRSPASVTRVEARSKAARCSSSFT